ncbi:UU173 family protein [[Mycoplasma] anseris]|uniref:DUF2779 domain-containing protein n=1 Tax=[Mycoplasma] anseris TaxID=92400 RepID=A0A2Z4NCD4_9BACT|nr:DUF2779 domain-containing protein [[Mycoplasma] anseris]AWX69167.1 DUF2779 domain-containing protein [[Mycoplasma] anseris]
MNKPKYFSFNHFFKLNKTHPYFMLNNELTSEIKEILEDEDDQSEVYNELNYKMSDIENQIEHFISGYEIDFNVNKQWTTIEKIEYLKENINENEQILNQLKANHQLDDFLSLISEYKELQIFATGLDAYQQKAIDALITYYKNTYKLENDEICILSKKASTEFLIHETTRAINKGFKVIINPVFEYQKAIASPIVYDKINNSFAILNFSWRTRRKNILSVYYVLNILRKNNLKIDDAQIFLPRLKDRKNYKKGELDFIFSSYAKNTKDGYSYKKNCGKSKESEYIQDRIYGKEKNPKKMIQLIDQNELDFFDVADSKFSCSFNQFVSYINNLEAYPKFFEFEPNLDELKSVLSTNNYDDGKDIIALVLNKVAPDLVYASSDLRRNLLFENKINLKYKTFYENELIKINPNFSESLNALFDEKHSNFVWFDFEGVSLPYPIIDFNTPWTQLPCQTSIIKTNRNQIYESNDYIYDPISFNQETLYQIICDIYDENADHYIVFNKGYESARINEAIEILEIYNQRNQFDTLKLAEARQKGNEINQKIVDLADFFKPLSKSMETNVGSAYIHISWLKSKYSIKLVEKYVTKHDLKLEHMIKPYNELEVKNGSMALALATSRAANAIKDQEWETKTKELKKYCHNDVLAMIMAFDLVKYILANKEQFDQEFATKIQDLHF